eukprot:1577027-Prymnesium_polylepis.2
MFEAFSPRVSAAGLVVLKKLFESLPLSTRLDDQHALRDGLVGCELLAAAAHRHHDLRGGTGEAVDTLGLDIWGWRAGESSAEFGPGWAKIYSFA